MYPHFLVVAGKSKTEIRHWARKGRSNGLPESQICFGQCEASTVLMSLGGVMDVAERQRQQGTVAGFSSTEPHITHHR